MGLVGVMKSKVNLQQKMATFFIQYSQPFYFAGDTVNGSVLINVGSMIVGAQGISLKVTGYECVKWVQAEQLHRPNPNAHRQPNQPPPYDPIAHIPPNQILNSDSMGISDCESEGNGNYDLRPKYIRTSQNRYYRMSYFETRNMFTRNKMMIYQCNGFAPGQYSFPFSYKTFQGWPASFNYYTPQKKGIITYNMTVAIEPVSPQFCLQASRQVILRETRVVSAQSKQAAGNITSCCCLSKGISSAHLMFEKDGFIPGDLVQMIIEVDNSQCTANITTITIGVSNTVTLHSNGNATSDSRTIFSKSINGLYAGQSAIGDKAIRQAFLLQSNTQIKPTCSGKLLSSQYSLFVSMNHDVSCDCCSDSVGAGIPVIIFPIIPVVQMPAVFQGGWNPQAMPMTTMVMPNTFGNANLNAMAQGAGYQMQMG